MTKKIKKRSPRVKIYPAPRKSAASYFFTSFFLTLTVMLCGAGFLIAYDHSLSVGTGRSVTAFAVSQAGQKLDITVAGNSFLVNTATLDSVQAMQIKLRLAASALEPAPVGFARLVTAQLDLLEEKLLARYGPY